MSTDSALVSYLLAMFARTVDESKSSLVEAGSETVRVDELATRMSVPKRDAPEKRTGHKSPSREWLEHHRACRQS